jgi:hypothetical protein
MPAIADPRPLLPPAAREELDRYPLTETEAAPHADSPLGAVAGWYYCGAGCGLLALELHGLTGLPLVGLVVTLRDRGARDLPVDVMLEAGVARDDHVLCACGWRATVEDAEPLVPVSAERVRALCADCGGIDPDDPPTRERAQAAARLLLERVGDAPA